MADATTPASGGETYAGAGVSIDAGEEAVERIKGKVRSTFRPEVIGDIDEFKKRSDIIIANRQSDNLKDVPEKVYTRDIYGRD